jgi:hypothetical protein
VVRVSNLIRDMSYAFATFVVLMVTILFGGLVGFSLYCIVTFLYLIKRDEQIPEWVDEHMRG